MRRFAGILLVSGAASLACAGCKASSEEEPVASTASAYSSRGWVDGNVRSFKALDATWVFVLGSDGNLWLEDGSMFSRTFVDSNVQDFQPIDGRTVYVLHSDGNLWREVDGYTNATWVDGNVAKFKAVDWTTVFVLGSDGKLWDETGTMANRVPVMSGVKDFQPIGYEGFYILTDDASLWRGDLSSVYAQIDANVASFVAVDIETVYALDTSANLWNETDTSATRRWVDGNVLSFAPIDTAAVLVQGTDGNLWREFFSYTDRDFVDQPVTAFQPLGPGMVYALDPSGNLWREQLGAPVCTYQVPAMTCSSPGHGYAYIAGWGVATASGECPNLVGANGSWQPIVLPDPPSFYDSGVPGDHSGDPPPDCSTYLPGGCCTYVWWGSNGATPDPSAFCTPDVTSIVALGQCGSYCSAGLTCEEPNGGGCDTCSPYSPIYSW